MAMPMAEEPQELYSVPPLLQDRTNDSPTVERVVINPFEEGGFVEMLEKMFED